MTNAELIATIQAKIEKLVERYGSVKAKGVLQEGYKGGRLIGYEDALNVLKRIQEESEKPKADLEKEIEISIRCLNGLHTLEDNKSWYKGRYEELKELARHFAQWGAEHLKK